MASRGRLALTFALLTGAALECLVPPQTEPSGLTAGAEPVRWSLRPLGPTTVSRELLRA